MNTNTNTYYILKCSVPLQHRNRPDVGDADSYFRYTFANKGGAYNTLIPTKAAKFATIQEAKCVRDSFPRSGEVTIVKVIDDSVMEDILT